MIFATWPVALNVDKQRPLDLALLVHDHRGADDADDRLAVQLLLTEGAVRLQDGLVGVADQGDLQGLLLAELGELLGLVRETPMTSYPALRPAGRGCP